jgi:hypothetical protein
MDCDHITRNKCDTCDTTSTGVMFHCGGTPVLFLCRTCDPAHYAHHAAVQIDTWLAGGLAMQDYVISPAHLRDAERSTIGG